MRVYVPDSFEQTLNRALKELELFKQSVIHNGNNSTKELDGVIDLLSDDPIFESCMDNLRQIHYVLGVETNLLIVERLRDLMSQLNNLR